MEQLLVDVDWKTIVANMAESLGTTAEYLWQVLVSGTRISGLVTGITHLLAIIVTSVLTWKLTPRLWRMGENASADSAEQFVAVVGLIVTYVATLLTSITFLSFMPDYGMQIFAPEYKAIEMILDKAK